MSLKSLLRPVFISVVMLVFPLTSVATVLCPQDSLWPKVVQLRSGLRVGLTRAEVIDRFGSPVMAAGASHVFAVKVSEGNCSEYALVDVAFDSQGKVTDLSAHAEHYRIVLISEIDYDSLKIGMSVSAVFGRLGLPELEWPLPERGWAAQYAIDVHDARGIRRGLVVLHFDCHGELQDKSVGTM